MKFQILLTAALMTIGSWSFADSASDLILEKKLSAEYLAQMALEKGAVVLEEGVVLRPIYKTASEAFASLESTVHVSYFLTDREANVLEECVSSDEDLAFPLKRLIKCWQIAIPKMPVGSLYKVSCPSSVAYGDAGAGDGLIKPGAALTFRITLFGL